jgi:protein phosphatase
MGTTVTALLRTGNRLALAHIGDSRAYLLRDDVLVQITRDHTFVQTLVDEGRLTAAEAEQHPQRSVLMRVLSDVVDAVEPDLSVREAKVGDRYLLCSDGLSGVVSFETLHETMAITTHRPDPATTCDALVQLALRAGAPDNVTCVIADIVDDAAAGDATPAVVGAASVQQPQRDRTNNQDSPAERAAALTELYRPDAVVVTGANRNGPATKRGRRWVGGLLVAMAIIVGGFTSWRWVNQQIFVGETGGVMAIFTGIPQDIGPVQLSHIREVVQGVRLDDLPDYARDAVRRGIPADDEAGAQVIVQRYRELAATCVAGPSPTASPSPSRFATLTPTQTPTPASVRTPGRTPTRTPVASPTGKPAVAPTASTSSTSPTSSVSPTAPLGATPTVTPANRCGGGE